ncbi:hypothetical protein [Caulobacter henricii]|nr:hypothetical protein [Caulobacter henricii]
MTTLSVTRLITTEGSTTSLVGLGETALRLMLVAALPISATIFFVQTF